jgi:hypothetical protein
MSGEHDAFDEEEDEYEKARTQRAMELAAQLVTARLARETAKEDD